MGQVIQLYVSTYWRVSKKDSGITFYTDSVDPVREYDLDSTWHLEVVSRVRCVGDNIKTTGECYEERTI